MIGAADLLAFNARLSRGLAAEYAAALEAAVTASPIADKPIRVRHFMAQLAYESAGFRGLTESLAYSAAGLMKNFPKSVPNAALAEHLVAQGQVAIGNWIYANKIGNGDIASGDGYRFRGRGFIQITGRGNYAAVEKYSGLPTLDQPDLLSEAANAALAGVKFWESRKIDLAADANDIKTVTLKINGGLNGLEVAYGGKLAGADGRHARLVIAETRWPDAPRVEAAIS